MTAQTTDPRVASMRARIRNEVAGNGARKRLKLGLVLGYLVILTVVVLAMAGLGVKPEWVAGVAIFGVLVPVMFSMPMLALNFWRFNSEVAGSFSCLQCGKPVEVFSPWECGHCQAAHRPSFGFLGNLRDSYFTDRCHSCEREPYAFACPHCKKATVFDGTRYSPTSGVGVAAVHDASLATIFTSVLAGIEAVQELRR